MAIQHRRGTAATWTTNNPVLADGQLGVETDTGQVKVGDGATAWTSLKYPAWPDLADDRGSAGVIALPRQMFAVAQNLAQIRALTKECNALIRMQLDLLDSTTGT